MSELTRPSPRDRSGAAGRIRGWNFRVLAALATPLAVAAIGIPWDRGEAESQNYRHHEHAARRWDRYQAQGASDDGPDVMPALKWVLPMGAADFMDGAVLAASDLDLPATRRVLDCLPYNTAGADQVLRDAQIGLGDAAKALEAAALEAAELEAGALEETVAVEPSFSYEQLRQLSGGVSRLARIRLFDSCRDDGDIVNLELNGRPFATVVLTAAGSEICLPVNLVQPQSNQLAVVAVWEGTDPGVTVGIATSQGTGYVRTLSRQERHALRVVNPLVFVPPR